jgi:hypothetical protein
LASRRSGLSRRFGLMAAAAKVAVSMSYWQLETLLTHATLKAVVVQGICVPRLERGVFSFPDRDAPPEHQFSRLAGPCSVSANVRARRRSAYAVNIACISASISSVMVFSN